MKTHDKRQLLVLALLLALFSALTFLAYAAIPAAQLLPPGQRSPGASSLVTDPVFALGIAAMIFIAYGLLGSVGYWFSRRLTLPGVFREGAGWKDWLLVPALAGLATGVALVLGDAVFTALGRPGINVHPPFPFAIIASATAAIGEEIIFRSFFLGSWAFILAIVLRRWKALRLALWLGVLIAALAFSAAHLPAAMVLLGASAPDQIPSTILVEFVLLNSLLGIVAGERYLKSGLVAAIGVHFWADVVWHVAWPLLSQS